MRARKTLIALTAAALVAVVAYVIVNGSESDGSPDAGRVKFMRNATSPFDRFIINSTPATQKWMREHYWHMRGYTPFFDQALPWAPPTHFYNDLYAIYPGDRTDDAPDESLIESHPDWVLRDEDGNRMFIPFNCSGGTCPQFAADPGNAEWRRFWIDNATVLRNRGYAGIHIDDVNLEMRVSDGYGNEIPPIDPRTGKAMTLADWREYVVGFMEQIRAEIPDVELSQNIIWFSEVPDDLLDRQLATTDYVELERGFTDPGLLGGDGAFSYLSLLNFIDRVHGQGPGVMVEPYDLTERSRLFELASYFLINNGNDVMISDFQADPDNWWPGWDVDLGEPTEDRVLRDDGVVERDFKNGLVLTNPPKAPPRTVQLDEPRLDLEGGPHGSVTLGPGEGAVLLDRDAP